MAFLIDELEEAFNSSTNGLVRAQHVAYVLIYHIPKPEIGIEKFLDTLKSIDNSYKDFCKNHPEFKEDGFRKIVLNKAYEGGNKEKLKKILGW